MKKDFEIEINGRMFPVQKEVFELTLSISKERDELREAVKKVVAKDVFNGKIPFSIYEQQEMIDIIKRATE